MGITKIRSQIIPGFLYKKSGVSWDRYPFFFFYEIKNIDQRRLIISSLVLSIVRYCSSIYSGQQESVLDRFHTTVMKIYRAILNQCTYKTRCEKICSDIKMPMPRELIAKDAMNFTHKLLLYKKPIQLYSLLKLPGRITRVTAPQVLYRPTTERSKRSSFNSMITTYNTLPSSLRGLAADGFKGIISKHTFNILDSQDQRN